jgi:hypothetical protein
VSEPLDYRESNRINDYPWMIDPKTDRLIIQCGDCEWIIATRPFGGEISQEEIDRAAAVHRRRRVCRCTARWITCSANIRCKVACRRTRERPDVPWPRSEEDEGEPSGLVKAWRWLKGGQP